MAGTDLPTCDALSAMAWRHRTFAPRIAPVQPLILKAAANRNPGSFVVREGRLGSWANTTRIFHMTHIAKTGGRSVRVELMRLVRPVGGAEQCYVPFTHASRINIVFFREPRGHALSQYLHGAYAGRTARRRAAGYPIVPGDDLAGFAKWVDHFHTDWTPTRGDFYGYNPLNMMARQMTCTDERWNCDYLKECDKPCAHHVGNDVKDAQPPLAQALAAVHTADFVGVLELLPEALCLIEYRKLGTLSPQCACAASDVVAGGGGGGGDAAGAAASGVAASSSSSSSSSGGAEAAAGKRVAHVMNSRRQRASKKVSVRDAAPSTLSALDEVLSVDLRVYRAAVLRVLCDLRALERATGTHVLCASRLAHLRNKTGYVPGLWDGAGAASLLDEWADARRGYAAAAPGSAPLPSTLQPRPPSLEGSAAVGGGVGAGAGLRQGRRKLLRGKGRGAGLRLFDSMLGRADESY